MFGTSARFLATAKSSASNRRGTAARLRTILSTGSPLAPESFDWVRRAVGPKVQVSSISGGTDIVSCFVLGNPLTPVRRGEIQGAGLGMAVDVLDDDGIPCAPGVPGELVCRRPFPSMPVAFWKDPASAAYHAAILRPVSRRLATRDWRPERRVAASSSPAKHATLNPGASDRDGGDLSQVGQFGGPRESGVAQQVPDEAWATWRIVLFVSCGPVPPSRRH